MEKLSGLTTDEADKRRRNGLGNDAQINTNRSYWDITRTNLFSTYNIILFTIGAILALFGRYNDAFITVIVGFTNATISTFQEIRAKIKLEQIAVVASTVVSVQRDGHEQQIHPSEVVQGDLVWLRSGDQAVVDGRIVNNGRVEMDESLLTGEAEHIRKGEGEQILSGSFCMTGAALYVAEHVGLDSYANQLTAQAKDFRIISTPLQMKVAYVINLLIFFAAIIGANYFLSSAVQGFTFVANVKATAVLVGLVPYGLFLTIAVAYALGATTIAQKGAIVQQTNAVESLSNVTVLCMDKTGTLTANELAFHDLYYLQEEDQTIQEALGDMVHSVTDPNKTSEAISKSLAGQSLTLNDEVSFSSVRKWSGVLADEPHRRGAFVLGAVEILADCLPEATLPNLNEQAKALANEGLRVLLFAHNGYVKTLHDQNGAPSLPPLIPLALVSIKDKLRPYASETIAQFQEDGVALKIISGDHPQTVTALAMQAGVENSTAVSGAELAQMTQFEREQAVNERTVFGRVSPEQKQQLVQILINQGHYVAMIGDGVNDVLSLKNAHLGIAMQSGSNATRNVADMVLLNDSYAALPHVLREGKKIVRGLTNATYLLIGRSLAYALIIIGVMMVGLPFPFEPAQTGLTVFSVGFPAFCLTIWARPNEKPEPLLLSLVRLIFPYVLWTMLVGVILYAYAFTNAAEMISNTTLSAADVITIEAATGVSSTLTAEFDRAAATLMAQSVLTSYLTLVAIIFILFLDPPLRYFAGWRPLSPDKRPLFLVIALIVSFFMTLRFQAVSAYFGMWQLSNSDYLSVGVATAGWLLIFQLIVKMRLSDRLFKASL